MIETATATLCRPPVGSASSAEAHAAVHAAARRGVGTFSSVAGPDRGNLACVWAVRHLLRAALGRMVTLTDNTDVFADELLSHFGRSFAERDVPAGGIIVSPSEGEEGTPQRIVGHIGLLGSGSGDHRLIYSNCSDQAVWLDHYAIGSWRERYCAGKHLRMLFFPIPEARHWACRP